MKKNASEIVAGALAVAIGIAAGIHALHAQQPPSVKRTILLKQGMTIPDRDAVMAYVDLPPGSAEGRHVHPAEVYGFVLEGTITQQIEGKPDATLKAGDFVYFGPGQVHQAINSGSSAAKLAAVFVADKGKPLTTPAP